MELFQTVVKGGRRVGAFAAVKIDNRVGIGWAKCKRGDRFDNKLAREICRKRAERRIISMEKGMPNSIVTVPYSLEGEVERFVGRCKKYYQDADLFVVA